VTDASNGTPAAASAGAVAAANGCGMASVHSSAGVQSAVACYVCQLATIPGKFDTQKAAQLGVPRGPVSDWPVFLACVSVVTVVLLDWLLPVLLCAATVFHESVGGYSCRCSWACGLELSVPLTPGGLLAAAAAAPVAPAVAAAAAWFACTRSCTESCSEASQ
jgi:hypothetical protein